MRTWGEQANPRRQWPQLRINYFPHQGYKKMTLDETMLFEHLLSVACQTLLDAKPETASVRDRLALSSDISI